MRRGILIVLTMASVITLFSGCKKEQEPVQAALDFRTALMGAKSCEFDAEVTAELGDKVYNFTLDCAFTPESGDADVSVTAPETIAGIAATVDGDDAQITFEGVSLELGTTAGGNVAPIQLPQLLGSAWTTGYIESVAQEESGWLGTYRSGYGDEQLTVLTRFTPQGTPASAEIYDDEVCILSASIDNFSFV